MIGEVFQTGGFGIGLAIGMLAMFVVNIKYRSPILISFTFHLLICTLIMFSYLAHYALSQKITKGIDLFTYYPGNLSNKKLHC